MPDESTDHAKIFRENNINQALTMIRTVSIHCVMYVPTNELDEATKALLHRHIMQLANLYEPGVAKI